MPFFDRFWWLRSLAALAIAAGAAALAVEIVLAPADFGLELSNSVARIALCVSLLGLLALIALAFHRGALRARRRKLARLATIRGPAPTGGGGGVALLDEPLRLLGRRSWGFVVQMLVNEIIIVASLPILVALLATWAGIGVEPGDLSSVLAFVSNWPLGWQLVVVGVVAFVPALAIVRLARRQGVVVVHEGVVAYSVWRRHRLIRWEDARLLEVRWRPASPVSYHVYTLYGPSGFARWYEAENLPNGLVPDGTSTVEMLRRSERLREYILARTDLLPQTIAPSARNASPEQLPSCLVWLVSQLHRSHEQPKPSVEAGELPEPPGWSYTVRQGMRWESRLALVAPGLILSVNVLPALALWFPGPISGLFGVASAGAAVDTAILAYLLFIIGAGALLLAWLAARSRIHTYRADAEGLTELIGRQVSAQIPWSRLQRLSRNGPPGHTRAYEAVGNAGRTRLTWLAYPFGKRQPMSGRSAIRPEQLFALAVKHSGVEPSESWRTRNLRRLRELRTQESE